MLSLRRVLVALAVCAMASAIYAKATKIRVIIPAGSGTVLNPDADGMVIMNYHESTSAETEIQVVVMDFEPNTTLSVALVTGGGFNAPNAFTTNEVGNGHFHFQTTTDVMQFNPNPTVKIYAWDGIVETMDDISLTELRGIGCVLGPPYCAP